MDLEWLLPEQIEQILRLCDLSSIHDPSLAANILQQHHWDLENALNELVGQNDHPHSNPLPSAPPAPALVKPQPGEKMEEYNDGFDDEFELAPHQYHQLDAASQPEAKPAPAAHSVLLAQQNKEYEEMEKSYIAKLAEDEEWNQYEQLKEQEYLQHKEHFNDHKVHKPIQIKFRLAHKSDTRAFDLTDTVQRLFTFVSGHLRDGFEHRHSEFDLTQAFPALTLKDKQAATLEEVFGESTGEVLIVKEL